MRLDLVLCFFILLLGSVSNYTTAQSGLFNSQKDTLLLIQKEKSNYKLDRLDIIPSSLTINTLLADDNIPYRLISNSIVFDSAVLQKLDSTRLRIRYRVLNGAFGETYNHLDTSILSKKDAVIYIGYDNQATPLRDHSIITEKGIDYDGSFARGFSLGNAQSLLLNSNFNMQLAGDLGEGIRVKAAISDDNIPIQPEGNTRLLQEFDKVFIEVSKDKNTITAGDYELRRPKSYFINYNKQVKGLSGYNEYKISPKQAINTRASFAVSRAKFNRYTLPVIEANQGPYKLVGANAERFIIIESGSEKVYEDGKLLVRGQNNDYVISYDQAEIIFTEKKLITSASRIIVEYEYVDRSFLRTMYAVESNYKVNKLDVKLNYYSLQDSKNTTGNDALDSTSLAILSASGDNTSLLRRSGIRVLEADRDASIISYKLITDSVLVYSTNLDSAIYTAFFSEVFDGTGAYVIDENANANGRVYKYVGPGLGSYVPEIQLIAPQKTSMISLGVDYSPSQNTKITSEVALSDFDLNRFSTVDNGDNKGTSAQLSLSHKFILNDSLRQSFVKPFIDIEFTEENFKFINPYRVAQEFSRDWNLKADIQQAQQLLLQTGLSISRNNNLRSLYKFSLYNRGDLYDGKRHSLDLNYDLKGFTLSTKNSLVVSQDGIERTNFFRPDISLSRSWSDKAWSSGIRYWAEENKRNLVSNDSLNDLSRSFRIVESFIQREIGKGFNGKIIYKDRKDLGVVNNTFDDLSKARDLVLSTAWKQARGGRLILDFTIRDFEVLNNDITTLISKKSYLGQLTYSNKFLGGAINTQTSYNLGSGQQAKIEYDYQEVLAGEGSFDWIDFNNDGIEQGDEFRVSTFQDTSRYIRIALYNNEFIQTNSAIINQSLRLDPKQFFLKRKKNKAKKKPLIQTTTLENKNAHPDQKKNNKKEPSKKDALYERVLSRISTTSNIRINKKVSLDGESYNPFDFSQNDTTIVNATALLNNTLFINRGNPAFDMQLGNRYNQSKLVQISGLEGRGLSEYFIRLRQAFSSNFDVILAYNLGQKTGLSENFQDKNFEIGFSKIAPQLNYRPTTNSRIVLSYVYTDKKERLLGVESLTNNDFSIEFSLRQTSKASWDFGLNFAQVRFDSDQNSSIAFELLEGLKPGKNYIWNNAYTRRLSGNIDLIINYEGRKNGTNQVVHTARAQVKATF